MNIKALIFLSIILLTGMLFPACVSSDLNINNIDTIIYRFQDSSVDPYYHRSYTIIVTESHISISVDVYSDVIAEKSYQLENDGFVQIKKVIELAELSNAELPKNPECGGGKSESLSFYVKDQLVFSGDVYHCGGSDSGTLSGDLDSIQNKLISLIPDFKNLLAIEYLK